MGSLKKITSLCLAVLFLSAASSCQKQDYTKFEDPPEWAQDAIWYQIFVERFRNGDPGNDPTRDDIIGSYPGFIPDNWEITPWGHDWYAPDPWFEALEGIKDGAGNPVRTFNQKVQLRRYGGDLQGVLDAMEYIDSLGVTAIYFNPLNDAPSLHKYDARNWRHVDVNFGPDPEGDKKIIASEIPDDPDTWVFTSADSLFLEVVRALHEKDIKVILDYSWNHTGTEFWAWKDLIQKQQQSEYADWYWVDSFDDPGTDENEFEYTGWLGVYSLPEIKETVKQDHSVKVSYFDGDVYSDAAREHIFAVTRRWLDPNGDGDPSDGVDGFRLDVAAEMPLGFWRTYREVVRGVNPDAYLVGEIWWEKYPDQLLDPAPALKGDVFDAPMNYRWYRSTRHFFNQSPDKITVNEYVDSLKSYTEGIRIQNQRAMMNLTASHDVPRFSTSIYNKNKYKFRPSPTDDPDYKIDKPDAETYRTMKLILAQQFTYIGSPHIWAGDEMGMWGADDPSTRKPLIWPDLEFEDETVHPLSKPRKKDKVAFDSELFTFYRNLINMRHNWPVLASGNLEYLQADAGEYEGLLAYSRYNSETEVLVVVNTADNVAEAAVLRKFDTEYEKIQGDGSYVTNDGSIMIQLPPRSFMILGQSGISDLSPD
jgi:glycosidase